MAFPTTGILDDANRTAEGPPPSANWVTTVIDDGTDGIKVTGNQFAGNGASSNDAVWDVQTFGPDTEVFLTIPTMADTLYMYLALGLINIGAGTTDGYIMRFDKEAANDEFNIARMDNGNPTFLHAGVQQEFTPGDSLGFERVDDDLTAYYKPAAGIWTPVLTVADATYTAAGKIGMMLRGGTMRADGFGGGTVVPAGGGGGGTGHQNMMQQGHG